MKLPFKIAVRFLKSNKGQTLLIMIGIAVGVSVQIFIGSLIQGLQKGLVNRTIGNSSQITVVSANENKFIENYNDIIKKIEKGEKRITKISSSLDSPAFIKTGSKSSSILVRGFDLQSSDKIYNIKKNIIKGNMPSNDGEVLIGTDLNNEIKVNVGDKVKIFTVKGISKDVTISGIYDLKVAALNKSWIITNIKTAQNIFDTNDVATSIEIQVDEKNIFNADIIASNVKAIIYNNDFKIENWKDQNGQLLSGLKGQSVSSIMIQVFVMISVLLGIASVLAISVVQKSKQIGILKAMGIKDRASSAIFLFQGALLGVGGAVLGVLLGLGLSYSFVKFVVNPDGTPVVDLYIDMKFILLSGLIAVIAATLASLIPARKSSKLDPMEVIKNG